MKIQNVDSYLHSGFVVPKYIVIYEWVYLVKIDKFDHDFDTFFALNSYDLALSGLVTALFEVVLV